MLLQWLLACLNFTLDSDNLWQAGRQVGVFRQKQYIKDKITVASLKSNTENKILKWAESFGWHNTKESCESLIFIAVSSEKEISFYRKGKEEKILK